MNLTVALGSSGRTISVTVPEDATVETLAKAARPKVSIHRQSYKFQQGSEKPVTLQSGKKLTGYGIKDGSTVTYKDLGPQVGYRTVFIVEYAGPIALLLFYASQPSFIYGAGSQRPFGEAQLLYMALFVAHFVKRELETLFVHKFSRPTMPLSNIFKNSIYYWSFAAFIGYVLCSPQYTPQVNNTPHAAAVAMCIFELGNFLVHVQLSRMRRGDGDQARNTPTGPLFSLVSCPNYTFEVLSWVAFSAGSGILTSWIFTLVGFLQMSQWAVKKHVGYIKADKRNKSKKAIVPFLL